MQLAEPRAHVALHAPVLQSMPVAYLATMTAVRYPAVAGTLYPADRDVLERQLRLFLSEADSVTLSPVLPNAIIGPHAGYVYSGPVAARACARLAAARGRISRVVLIGAVALLSFPRPRRRYWR
jgi:Memo-like protein